MKFVYCSNCGTRLEISRKAMPKYGRIIDIIPPHVCPDEPVELDFTLNPIPTTPEVPDGKFVQKLNKLEPPVDLERSLKDRRPNDQVKQTSIAPSSLREMISNKIQAGETSEPETSEDQEPE
jgi:hypothetical protein